jgi:hypothetical protein
MLKDLSPATSEPEKAEELPLLRRGASLAVAEPAELLDVVLLAVTSEIDRPGCNSLLQG